MDIKVDVSKNFQEVVTQLQNNHIPFYITGSLAMNYYLTGQINLVINKRDDIDIVVSSKSIPLVEHVFNQKFIQVPNSDGTKINHLEANEKIDISLFNDFLVNKVKIDFSSNQKLFLETKQVSVNKVTFNLANTRLLLALKLTLFRGASVNEPCDKKDVADFKKFYLLENPLQDELETIVPKVISDPQFITEIIELFTERYNRITQL